MGRARIVAGAILVLALYCGTDPFNHSAISDFPDFQAYKVDMPLLSELPTKRDTDDLLQKSERMILNQGHGPESIAFDQQGRGPYTGVADGRILFWNGENWTEFAHTSPHRSELCDPKSSPLSYIETEHICGRPLGIRFDKRTSDLYIADAYFGLMKVGPEGGLATSVTTEAEGIPFKFTNDLDIDEEGNIYFTDSSAKYQRRNFLQLLFSSEDSGRILKYDPITKETTVLVGNIQFPNGLTLSKDGSFFVFCEGIVGRLKKYWLKGERAGTTEIMAILPGSPDNVRTNKNGEFWVAIRGRRTMYSHLLFSSPKIRTLMLRLPIPTKIQYLINLGGWSHAIVIKYGPESKLLKILEDRKGRVVKAVSEVQERDGKLWIGSVLMPFIAVYNL